MLTAALSRWTEPQERFEQLRKRAVATHGPRLCDLSYANPPMGPVDGVRDALRSAIDSDRALALQYTPYGGATIPRRHVAYALRDSHGDRFGWRDVVLTPGAMAALCLLFRTLAAERPGAEVIVPVPCWMDYPLYLENLGLVPRLIPLRSNDLGLDLEAVAAALNPGTCAMVLSQPANPSGRIYDAGSLAALATMLRQQCNPPLLISDECHRDLCDAPIPSPQQHYERTCIVYSFGKHLHLQGQRLGYVAVSPSMPAGKGFAEMLERWCRIMGFCTPTALMQRALPELAAIRPNLGPLQRRRERAAQRLQEAGIRFYKPDGGLFLYCAAGATDDFTQAENLADHGVLVMPSTLFHHEGHLRLCLEVDDATAAQGIDKVIEVIAREAAA